MVFSPAGSWLSKGRMESLAAAAAALTSSTSRTGGEEKGSAPKLNLTVGFTRNPMHRPARCIRPNSLYYILTVRPAYKVSNAPSWWALLATRKPLGGLSWPAAIDIASKLLTLLLPGCSSLGWQTGRQQSSLQQTLLLWCLSPSTLTRTPLPPHARAHSRAGATLLPEQPFDGPKVPSWG